MDPIHPTYATSDPLFYDRPRSDPSARRYSVPKSRAWTGWISVDESPWSHWLPAASRLPDQGWKVHVSAVPESAAQALRVVGEYCHDHRLAFKFLRDEGELESALAKDAHRGSAGKFITVYPSSERQLRTLLHALDAELGGLPGPYILSDLRWNDGPLHVRYGAFILQRVRHDGVDVPAIRDTGSGILVPDVRGAGFIVPPWVTVPDFLAAQLAVLSPEPPRGFPTVTGALHHSNAGGVYTATIAGREVILKEARPHCGRTPDRRDARARLANEVEALRAMPPEVPTPRVISTFEHHGHEFLAMERIHGEPLSRLVTARNPLGSRSASASDFSAYRAWSREVADQLRSAVGKVHRAGRTHGDLHPANVLVDGDGLLTLIDFEMSGVIGTGRGTAFGVPGFVASGTEDPVARDRFAVACIELHMFLPLTPLIQLDSSKARSLPAEAAVLFGLPQSWADDVSTRLEAGLRPSPRASTPGGRPTGSLSAAVASTLASDADHTRFDRLWPGDPRQFQEEPFAVAHGALGVAVALCTNGSGPDERARDWITAVVRGRGRRSRLGLMDGLAGAIWACRSLGWTELADDMLAELVSTNWQSLGPDLYSGVPGVALTLLTESAHHPALLADVDQALASLGSHVASAVGPARVAAGRGGLLRGASGTALLALRMYDVTGERTFLDTARSALEHDMCSLVEAADGSLHVNEGWRSLPYLGFGSAGIGLVLAQYLTVDYRSDYAGVLDRITSAACTPFTAQVGLLQGRAGLMSFLAELHRLGLATVESHLALARHSTQLGLHALSSARGQRFAGDGLLRASCDLATGSAGVLMAVHSALYPGERSLLPWMQGPTDPVSASESAELSEGGEVNGVSAVASNA